MKKLTAIIAVLFMMLTLSAETYQLKVYDKNGWHTKEIAPDVFEFLVDVMVTDDDALQTVKDYKADPDKNDWHIEVDAELWQYVVDMVSFDKTQLELNKTVKRVKVIRLKDKPRKVNKVNKVDKK